MRDAVRGDIGLDLGARPRQPGPQPAQTVALDRARHRRQAGRTGAAQRLQQEGLGLVVAVVGQQHDAAAGLARHVGQRAVAALARQRLQALAGLRLQPEMADMEMQVGAFGTPALALARAVVAPVVGEAAQAVVNMQRMHRQDRGALPGQITRCPPGGVQQRHRVAPATAGDRDRTGLEEIEGGSQGADQALVSVKRP